MKNLRYKLNLFIFKIIYLENILYLLEIDLIKFFNIKKYTCNYIINMASLRHIIETEALLENSAIRKTDSYKDLDCFCSDSPQKTLLDINTRGVIFHNDKLIFKPAPYPYEFHYSELPKPTDSILDIYDESFIGDLSQYKISKTMEGTIIRVFNFNDEWFTTTNRKLNAMKSKWGKESFGEIFVKTVEEKTKKPIDEFYKSLNKDYYYTFIIGTVETTRIVSPVKQYIIITSIKDKNGIDVVDENYKSWMQKKLHFKTIKQMIDYVESFNMPFDNGFGLYLSSKDKNIKIINKTYKTFENLRNNLPSIPFAYLHNCFNFETRNLFISLYPNFKDTFEFYDKEIFDIAEELKKYYYRRHVYKENFMVTKTEHCILYEIHKLYLNKKTPINIGDIIEVFKSTSPVRINQMITARKLKKNINEKQKN